MNPLSACIFKCTNLKSHFSGQGDFNNTSKENVWIIESFLINVKKNERDALLRSTCDKWYAKAVRLLHKGADPTECRVIVPKKKRLI